MSAAVTVWIVFVLNMNTGTVERGGEADVVSNQATCVMAAAGFNRDNAKRWPELRAICTSKTIKVSL